MPEDRLLRPPAGKLFLGHEDAAPHERVMVPRDDFLTHAVVLGKTGSGKTGLMHVLLEEVVMQGASAIVIDPKGDLTNLLLAFPDLDEGSLKRWAPSGCAPALEAQRIREGLAASGQALARVGAWASAATFKVYAPGKLRGGGESVNVLPAFGPPEARLSPGATRARASSVVSPILAAIGVKADPASDQRHVFLTECLLDAWGRGEALPLEAWAEVLAVPPEALEAIDSIAVDDFLPPRARNELARALVGFRRQGGHWLEGAPLDVSAFLAHTPDGRPRVSIFTLRHLDESDRLFFVSVLLAAVVDWMFKAPTSTRLRALLAIDEARGFCPPYPASPATKRPLATLLSQARAQGLGVLLGTQHPVDLDYKALSNVGTWFLGGLRARDLERDLEGELRDRGIPLTALEGLPERCFLTLTRDGGRHALRTRWALSYLRGPIDADELTELAPAP